MFSQVTNIDETLFVDTATVSLENSNSKRQNTNLNIKVIAIRYFNKFWKHNKKIIKNSKIFVVDHGTINEKAG